MFAIKSAKKYLQKMIGAMPQEPNDHGRGDLSIACFGKENPALAAEELSSKPLSPLFEKAEATGPYVNYFFSKKFYARVLSEALDYDCAPRKSKPIAIEYSQPNPGKPMHLGHIRSTIIGDVCARLLEFLGHRVIRLNYLNDRGAHIAELITALKEFKDLPIVTDEKDLLAYYVKIKKEIDENPELKEKTRNVLEHLKDCGEELKKIREMSWTAFQRNYSMLGVSFDEIPLETALEDDAKKIVVECLKKKLVKVEADGATIALLEPELPNTVLLRSNKTPLYFTSDLALADWKWKKYHFAESYIFTASEQNLHFRQLQLLLRKLGRPYAERYRHRGFGLIKLVGGKMSTREGRVVLLEDVLNEATEEAKKQVLAKAQASDVEGTALAVGVGALKFGVLRISMQKDITFDPSREVEFEGDTSAYVQYAHVRCCGILEKADLKPKQPKTLEVNEAEKSLLKKLAYFPETVSLAAKKLEPHTLCDYALDLAHAFTRFYDTTPVINAETESLRNQRLCIVAASKNVLSLTLGLLGVNALEKM